MYYLDCDGDIVHRNGSTTYFWARNHRRWIEVMLFITADSAILTPKYLKLRGIPLCTTELVD